MRQEIKESFRGSWLLSSVIGWTAIFNWIQILSDYQAINRYLWFVVLLINITCMISYGILWLRHHK